MILEDLKQDYLSLSKSERLLIIEKIRDKRAKARIESKTKSKGTKKISKVDKLVKNVDKLNDDEFELYIKKLEESRK